MEHQSVQAIYTAAEQLIAWKRYKEALAEAEQALRQEPEDPDGYALLARIYHLMDEHEKALHWAGETLKRDPGHEQGWFVRVAVYYETDNDPAFEAALQEALRIDPYEAHYYFLKANRLNKKGKFQESREQLLQALDFRPEAPLYLATLSYTEALLGNFDESRRLDRQAAQVDAESPHVLLYLAWAASQRGEFDLQETYMSSAIRLNPASKQFQDEYLKALQQNHVLFRYFLWPTSMLRRLKPWQIFLSWVVAWLLFKPLLIVFLMLYVLSHWVTKAVVHVRVFGWRRRGS